MIQCLKIYLISHFCFIFFLFLRQDYTLLAQTNLTQSPEFWVSRHATVPGFYYSFLSSLLSLPPALQSGILIKVLLILPQLILLVVVLRIGAQ